MSLSDDLSQLIQGLRHAGASGRQLQFDLLRHLTQCVQQLTSSLEEDVMLPSDNAAPDGTGEQLAEAPSEEENSVRAPESPESPGGLALGYDDDAAACEQARQVFDTRPLCEEEHVILWLDAMEVWGRPIVVCMAATIEGYRRILGFVEAPLHDAERVQHLLQGLLELGLCADRGLFCITPDVTSLTDVLQECLGTGMQQQHCQMHKRTRVVSYLSEQDGRRIRGAITRAFAVPDPKVAHAALMQIHTDLLVCNRSAARWLLRGLDRTLTLHRTGLYEQLSPSLRSTRCVAHVSKKLVRRLRDVRLWMPPDKRRACLALLLLEIESHMRRLPRAAQDPAMRSALFPSINQTNDN